MSQPHPTIINAPLNFRTSDTLITTKVPHYPPKVNTGTYIIPGWTRPNANGMNANINQADFNGPDFKARPLKHWRRQLRVYNNNGKGPSNNSRTARIADLDRPGLTVYHHDPNCACVDDEGGNSYIIANNKFSYETKGNQYSELRNDATIQNNGFNRVPSNATPAQVADPLTPAYEVLIGVYNTNCINCSPQNNRIKGAIAYNSQAYYADSFAKQQSRCQTYEQNISTNRADTSTYFGADGEPLWPNNSPTGPQVVEPVEYTPIRLYNKPCVSQTIYKPNNVAFAKQGAVSGATRLRKLVADTVMLNGSSFYSAAGAAAANLGQYQGTNVAGNYYVKMKPVVDSCSGGRPCKQTLELISIQNTEVNLEWYNSKDCDNNSGLCPILYYTLYYYISSQPNNVTTIYIPGSNNTSYMLTNLIPGNYYDIYVTATNGNGVSKNSNILQVTITAPSVITISLNPNTYVYTYSASPQTVIVTLTSPNTNSPIVCSIINNNPTNVATIAPDTTPNTYIVTINNAGFFNLYATQAAYGVYPSTAVLSNNFTVNPLQITGTPEYLSINYTGLPFTLDALENINATTYIGSTIITGTNIGIYGPNIITGTGNYTGTVSTGILYILTNTPLVYTPPNPSSAQQYTFAISVTQLVYGSYETIPSPVVIRTFTINSLSINSPTFTFYNGANIVIATYNDNNNYTLGNHTFNFPYPVNMSNSTHMTIYSPTQPYSLLCQNVTVSSPQAYSCYITFSS